MINARTDPIPVSSTPGVLCLAAVSIVALAALTFAPAYGLSSTLVLDPIPDRVYAGDKVSFTGTLTGSGQALPGRTVWICADYRLAPDECLAYAVTNEWGRYYTEWVAKEGIFGTNVYIYATFDGDDGWYADYRLYANAQSLRHTMSVYKYGGSIQLDPIPNRAAYGDVISLSGTLSLDAHSPEGSVVYIKDEDSFNPDDLLTTAYVDASGRFTTYWIVADVDPDYTIDIQAVYEGSPLYYRMATPIQKLDGYERVVGPDTDPVPNDGYMEIYRSLDFDRSPRVAIVLSSDSYNEVRGHIVPVQEGILGLTAMLESAYPSGDWSVDFEVVEPGSGFDEHPDVIVNLVTRDDDSDCNWDWDSGGILGWASIMDPKPVPTTVCSYGDRTNFEVGATAVHEFIHAIGVGHTFNIPRDMLCSTEAEYGETCPGLSNKSTTPSVLNLAAVAAVYGTDGFQNPNNQVKFKERFTLGDSPSGGLVVSQPGVSNTERLHNIAVDTDAIRQHLGLGSGQGISGGTNTGKLFGIAVDTDAIRQHLGLGSGQGISGGTNTGKLFGIAVDTDAIRQHLGLGSGQGISGGTNTGKLFGIAVDTDAIRQHILVFSAADVYGASLTPDAVPDQIAHVVVSDNLGSTDLLQEYTDTLDCDLNPTRITGIRANVSGADGLNNFVTMELKVGSDKKAEFTFVNNTSVLKDGSSLPFDFSGSDLTITGYLLDNSLILVQIEYDSVKTDGCVQQD